MGLKSTQLPGTILLQEKNKQIHWTDTAKHLSIQSIFEKKKRKEMLFASCKKKKNRRNKNISSLNMYQPIYIYKFYSPAKKKGRKKVSTTQEAIDTSFSIWSDIWNRINNTIKKNDGWLCWMIEIVFMVYELRCDKWVNISSMSGMVYIKYITKGVTKMEKLHETQYLHCTSNFSLCMTLLLHHIDIGTDIYILIDHIIY